MQSIDEMLRDRRPQEPPQVEALKTYAKATYETDVQVIVHQSYYLVKVANAALAYRFRVDSARIREVCHLDKRLVVHIGY